MRRALVVSTLVLVLNVITVFATVRIQQNNGQNYTAVLSNGATSEKFDIVFIGDGFTANDQASFNDAVNSAVDALRARPGYSETMCAFNIWRVNVVSTDSGIDHPMQNISRNTELDCRYGNTANGEAERCITSDSPAKCFEAAAYAPDADAIFVLVNDTQFGGCAGSLVFSSIASGFDGIITHELGHKIGALADEYECYVCDGSDSNRSYTGSERPAANVTTNTNRATTKWHDLIQASTAIPTTSDNPAGVVGLFAGGDYFAQGIFRPQFTCHMRTLGPAFCAVCARTLRQTLRDKCTACELNPGSYWCIFGDLLKRWRFMYSNPLRVRWPIPICLSCPFPERGAPGEEVVLTLTGIPEDFRLQAVDDQGKVVAQGRRERNTLEIRFTADPSRRYDFELTSGDRPTRALLDIGATLTRNGQLQQLPAVGGE